MTKRVLFIISFYCITNSVLAQSWSQLQKIVASNITNNQQYGLSVAIDGDYAAVGTYLSNAVYVYQKQPDNTWNEVQILTGSDPVFSINFGVSIAIDGDYMVVGADEGWGSEGAAYVFKNINGIWTEQQLLHPNSLAYPDHFGSSVDIKDNFIIVGAPEKTLNSTSFYTGAAYMFKKEDNSEVWNELSMLQLSSLNAYDYFGLDVAITQDYAIVGSYAHDYDVGNINNVSGAGAVFVFEKQPNDSWTFLQKLIAPDRNIADNFGISVSIDGEIMAVGSKNDYDASGNAFLNVAGAVYVFNYDNGLGGYTFENKIVASDRIEFARFGNDVSIEGNSLIVGSYPTASTSPNGAAYIYQKENGIWNETEIITASDGNPSDAFGYVVGISGNNIVVGAPYDDDESNGFNNSGSIYITGDSNPLDIEDYINNEIKLYPNPTSGKVNIDLSQINENSKIEVFNCLGQLVYTKKLNGGDHNFEIIGNPGLYFAKISSNNILVGTFKIIKE